jgi:hypothetical protein
MADVSTKSAAVVAMEPDWALVDDLMGGTKAMRAAATTRMPRWPLETAEAYNARLATATLLPAFSETVATMAGRVFAKPLAVGEDVLPQIATDVLPNVDLEGRNLHAFAADVFEEALSKGLSFILVDFPRVEGAVTRADEKRIGARPYWVQIKARQVLGWKSQLVDGLHRLTQFRYREAVSIDDGEFGSQDIEQVRVLEPGRCRLYRKDEKKEWQPFEDFPISVTEIPLVPIYTGRTGFLTAVPPLLELAHLNVKHWQSQSDQDTILHTARVPLLLRKGAEAEQNPDGTPKPMQISGSLIDVPEGGDLKYVEHTGAAIEAGQTSLEALEDQMKTAGAKLLTKTVLSLSESQSADEQAKEVSQLAAMAEALTDGLDQALVFTAQWMGITGEAGHIALGADLSDGAPSVQGAETLLKAEAAGVVSKSTVFAGLKRAGLVASDVDWEGEQQRVNEQPPAPPARVVL